jgi:hypothetical protein
VAPPKWLRLLLRRPLGTDEELRRMYYTNEELRRI